VSENSKILFRAIAERYAAAGNPDRQTHHFDVGATTDTHRELEVAGLIQRIFGIPGGVGWRLTEAGVEELKKQG
jgi:hypothetical protein